MNNIFLTGKVKVGKSTILNKALEKYKNKISIGGFRTIPIIPDDNQGKVYYLEKIGKQIDSSTKCSYICFKGLQGSLEPKIETFETYGVDILRDCFLNSSRIIVMDELGVFESRAEKFQYWVNKCLDSDITVLGVIKDKESTFLDKIRKRNDLCLLNVTKENRNAIYREFMVKIDEIFANSI